MWARPVRAGGRQPLVGVVADDGHARGAQLVQRPRGLRIGRRVVDDDDLDRLVLAHRGDGLLGEDAVVEARDDHRDPRRRAVRPGVGRALRLGRRRPGPGCPGRWWRAWSSRAWRRSARDVGRVDREAPPAQRRPRPAVTAGLGRVERGAGAVAGGPRRGDHAVVEVAEGVGDRHARRAGLALDDRRATRSARGQLGVGRLGQARVARRCGSRSPSPRRAACAVRPSP